MSHRLGVDLDADFLFIVHIANDKIFAPNICLPVLKM